MRAPNFDAQNPLALAGIEFVEFASPRPDELHELFVDFGFSLVATHATKAVALYRQNDIHFMLNREPRGMAGAFATAHGPSICAMGWRTANAALAAEVAANRGARLATQSDHARHGAPLPAIVGIGGSLIYLVDGWDREDRYAALGFVPLATPVRAAGKGLIAIDHLTNNVAAGTMSHWAEFYKSVFGFTEVRYFDIRGVKTGLVSYALRSPCGNFCIPINEATEPTSQIQEFLDEYQGPGIQHLAFLTHDLLATLRALDGARVQFLDIEPEYYRSVWDRVANVRESRAEIAARNVLVDGDQEGYLLQIFTKPVVGPIFIELIQRHNHQAFGEGNFGALFRSIERDQEKRGLI